MASLKTSVMLDERELVAARKLAAASGMTVSAWLNRALRNARLREMHANQGPPDAEELAYAAARDTEDIAYAAGDAEDADDVPVNR